MKNKKGMGLGTRMQQLRQKQKERKKAREKESWSEDAVMERELAKEVKEVEREMKREASGKEKKVSHGRNQWKASRGLRTIVSLGLCAALVTEAFSGVRMVGNVRKMWDMDRYALSSNQSFSVSENFVYLLDEYLQAFELYLDISRVIAPEGKIDYNTVLLEGEDKNYTLDELYQAEGNRYDYQYYIDNYIEHMPEYGKTHVDLLEMTQEIRSLEDMAVINDGKVYYTPELAKELSEKEKKELLQWTSQNTIKTYSEQKTLLPSFDGVVNDKTVKLFIPEKEAEIEAKSEYQEWIIEEYPEYAKGYMLLQIVNAYEQNFKGEIDGVEAERYKKICNNLYRGECFLSRTSYFYETEEGEMGYDDYYTGEEHHIGEEQLVYSKKGKTSYARDVRDEFGHDSEVYSMSQKMYMEELKKEAEGILKSRSKNEIPWGAPVLPYSLKEAQDYARFLVEFYDELHELFCSSRFDCYFECGDMIVKSNESWAYIQRKINNLLKSQKEDAKTDWIYAYYNSNGGVFDTNLPHTYFDKSGECVEYLEQIGKSYGESGNYISAFIVNLENIDNNKGEDHFVEAYQVHQEDQVIYDALEEKAKQEAIYFVISFAVILLAMVILLIMTGHEKESDVIVLKWHDRIWLEIVLPVFCFAVAGFLALCWEGVQWYQFDGHLNDPEIFQIMVWGMAAVAAVMAGMLLSFAKRLKAGRFLHTSVICSNLFRLKRGMSRLLQKVKSWNAYIREFPILIRYILVIGVNVIGGIFGLWHVAEGAFGYSFFIDLLMFIDVVGLIALDGYCMRVLMKNAMADEKIREGAERIAGGELSYQIEVPSGISKEQENLAKVINSIGEGLEKAVEESVRSERMKTELITNVSHDIKTPLTSVINYVDLLKRENIESERAQEYLKILDQKSQRLKVLIEDLVEASKASSGAMELQISKLNFNELVNQTDGEFEEKFQAAGLTMVSSISEDVIVFKGDGRRVYRILENLYGNVAKYAMPGTRVYTELYRNQDTAVFTIKNISREPLNISPQELTERFVRGEQSRSTEGSGLGLSIAKSLTELMDGSFEIHMDGDLFRVTISFPAL